MLEVRNLTKSFGKLTAVGGVSFEVRSGSCVGLLGPNGAGKTTTVSMIAGIMRPDGGEVLLDGEVLRGDTDPKKKRIGLVPQDLALYEELTAGENLAFFGALYDISPAKLEPVARTTLQLVGLEDRAGEKVKTFSGGMKRRLNLAASLLHQPDLLILDEPTTGVDPQSRSAIFANLETLKGVGKAILYTTHYMEEAERLCDRIVIMDHGQVMASDTLRGLATLMPKLCRMTIDLDAPLDDAGLYSLRALAGVNGVERKDNALTLELAGASDAAPVLAWLNDNQRGYQYFTCDRPDLESIFLTLTGRALRDG